MDDRPHPGGRRIDQPGALPHNRKDWVLLIPDLHSAGRRPDHYHRPPRPAARYIIAPAVLLLVALPFFVVFLFKPKENWWALIPS